MGGLDDTCPSTRRNSARRTAKALNTLDILFPDSNRRLVLGYAQRPIREWARSFLLSEYRHIADHVSLVMFDEKSAVGSA